MMAINLTRRPDLEERIVRLQRNLKIASKVGVIERALDTLERQSRDDPPDREAVEAAFREFDRKFGHLRLSDGVTAKELEDELYDEHGLPK